MSIEDDIAQIMHLKKEECRIVAIEEKRDKMTLKDEMSELLNKYSIDNKAHTPDFILAEFLKKCLDAFTKAVNATEKWNGIYR